MLILPAKVAVKKGTQDNFVLQLFLHCHIGVQFSDFYLALSHLTSLLFLYNEGFLWGREGTYTECCHRGGTIVPGHGSNCTY